MASKANSDAKTSAQDVGTYKPNPANFDYMLGRLDSDLGLKPEHVLHTAQSLHHDHVPARAKGLANVWIDRQRLSQGGHWGATAEIGERPQVDHIFFSMGEMAAAVLAAIS